MSRSAVVLTAVLVCGASAPGASQLPAERGQPFRTIRGRVIADDGSAQPLRRVKIVLAGAAVDSTPAYSDVEGRFELPVPQGSAYTLNLTKAGFAPLDVPPAALTTGDVELRMARGAAITGTVLDPFGDPVMGRVRVRLVGGGPEWSGESDDLGEFRVGSLPAGRYAVTFTALGARADAVSGHEPSIVQLRAGEETSLSVVLVAAASDPRVRIGSSRAAVVENGGVIRGLVLTSDSRPIGGAAVALIAGFEGARETTSDADGRYEFAGLPAGTYRITATKWGTSLTMRDRNLEVRVAERQAAGNTHVIMQRPAAIVGTVLDEYGDPVEGLMVEVGRLMPGIGGRGLLQNAIGPANPPRRTDDRGRFRVSGVPPGDYYVSAGEAPRVVGDRATGADTAMRVYYPGTPSIAEALTVRVVGGQDTLGVNIGFVVAAGARVYGYAFDSTGEALTFPISLMDSFRSGRPMMVRREAVVRPDGAFTFLNVPPGDYVVQGVRRPTPGRSSELAIEHITVSGPEVPPLTLRTSRGTPIRGRVVLDGDTSSVTFDQFGVGVTASDLDYNPIGLDMTGSGVSEEGTFELRAQGPVRITSRSIPQGWWLKSAMIGAIDAAEQPYEFGGSSETPVDVVVVFSNGVAEIAGRVTNARGEPVRGATVLVFPVDPSRWHLSSRYVKLARVGLGPPQNPQSVPAGDFRVPAVPPGDYWILAVDRFDVATEWQEPELMAALSRLAERITVTERQKVSRDLRLVERPSP